MNQTLKSKFLKLWNKLLVVQNCPLYFITPMATGVHIGLINSKTSVRPQAVFDLFQYEF